MKLVRTACALHFLALSFWVGGLAAIAFVVAPTAFNVAPRETAGLVVGDSLRAFGRLELILGAVALFSALICQFVGVWGPRVRWPRLLALVAMAGLSLVYTQAIYPPMQELRPRRAPGNAAEADFNRLHRMSTRVVGANLLLGIVVLGTSAATMRSPDGS
jgi:putative copper export protein